MNNLEQGPIISIAVLNRNGIDRLKKVVPSYISQNYNNIEILFFDNGSTDESIEYLESFPQIRIIKSSTNLGYGVAKNLLVKEARGEYVLLLDNDIELASSDLVSRLYEIYGGIDNSAFLSPLVKDSDKTTIDSLGLFYNRSQKRIELSECLALGDFPIPAYMGNAVFFKRNIFLSLGGYDEIYPINIDDYDLSARAYLMGYKNYMTSQCLVIHHGIEIRKDPKALGWRYGYYFSGFSRMMWKNYTMSNLVIWWPVSTLWIFWKSFLKSMQLKSIQPIKGFCLSVLRFFHDLGDTLSRRRELQGSRSLGSDDFLSVPSRL